jgi:TPP-dependent pyruvate/acetoin dehydrogenase alpha subunit
LGRSTKEYEYWFSRDLVDETENFLKKQKIQLTKESFNSLVKFISKKIDSTKKMP